MFDFTSTKLLLLAVVALLVIGPKDFPILLRTIGKYVAIIRGHAKEFRAQFDEAIRDSDIGQIKSDIGQFKKDIESFGRETEATMTTAQHSVEKTIAEARQSVEASVEAPVTPTPPADAAAPEPAATSAAADEPPPKAPESATPPLQPADHPVQAAAPAPAHSAAIPAAVERTGA
jgi:sec-independent protein translocase protein TatB